jgi:hypothetical protein
VGWFGRWEGFCVSEALGKAVSVGDDGVPDADRVRWVVLVYKVPAEPTRLRAGVWRKIKGMGAIYLQNSVAALPQSTSAERSLRMLRNEITEMAGSAYLLEAQVLSGGAEIEHAFNATRDDEYEEIVDRCQDFLGQIEKEYKAEHFTYAELEENDEDLVKLRNWFAKVQARAEVRAGAGRVRGARLRRGGGRPLTRLPLPHQR